MADKLPKPPIDPEAYVGDMPYPRDLFIELLVEAGCPANEAERLVDEALGSLARIH